MNGALKLFNICEKDKDPMIIESVNIFVSLSNFDVTPD